MRTILAFLFSASGLHAVNFAWEPNPATDSLTNYVLHWGTNSGRYLATTNCGTVTNFSIQSAVLFAGTNFVVLTAQNDSGFESAFSIEASFVLPSSPKNFRIKLSMDSAPTPTGPWTEAIVLTNSFAVQDTAYFRGRLDIQPSSGVP